MRKLNINPDAISEITGALILTSLIALVIGIIAVGFLSQGTPAYVPAVRIDLIEDESNDLVLIHRGGDTLLRETTRIDVNGGDRTEFFKLQGTSGSWTTWAVGEHMVLPDAHPPGSNISVKIIYTGVDSPALLATLDTGTGPTTSPPTTIVTTVPTTSPLPTPTPTPVPVTYSAYWPLSEGSGSVAGDSVGPNDGSIINGNWIDCPDRGYLVFDGTSSYVTIPANASLTPVSSVSFEAWVYPIGYKTAKIIQMRDWDGHGLDIDVWKGWQGGVTRASGGKTTIDWTQNGNRRPDLFTWYHLALVYDNATLRLYVNGVEEKRQPITGNLRQFTAPIRIGSEGGQKFFNGSIANVGYSTGAFTAAEVAARAANPPGGCPPAVNFSANTTIGQKPLTVAFSDTTTRLPYAWSWNFGDGNTSTQQNPVHTYENAGNYTVTLDAKNIFGTASHTKIDYIQVTGESFVDFVVNENVFIYGNRLSFAGNTISGPGATIILTGGLNSADINRGASVAATTIYIDGDVTLDGGSASLGSPTQPGNIYINGDLTLGTGARHIYGDVYVNGDFILKDARIYGTVYVDGDLTLQWTPWLADNARIYYTGKFTHPPTMDPALLAKCMYQPTVPGFDMPDQQLPPPKSADWYAAKGYVPSGILTSNLKIYAPSYSSTSWSATASNVIIVAHSGDITLTNLGSLTGVLFAPNGRVTFGGATFTGVVITRDGFFVTSGGTSVTFSNLAGYFASPDGYPF